MRRHKSGSYGRGIRRGLPAVEVYRPFRFTDQRPCLSVSKVYRTAFLITSYRSSRFTGCSGLRDRGPVYRSSRFTGRRSLLAVEVYRPSRFTGWSGLPASDLVSRSSRFTGHRGLPAIKVHRPSKFTGQRPYFSRERLYITPKRAE